FDESYLRRLREGDPSTERHFVVYFSQLLKLKLRARYLAADVVDELSQETFSRVLRQLRFKGGIRQPDRLAAFVNSVCNNVLLEHYRFGSRTVSFDPSHADIHDKVINLERWVISNETGTLVRRVLSQIPERDRDILKAVFLDDMDKQEVCSKFAVTRD